MYAPQIQQSLVAICCYRPLQTALAAPTLTTAASPGGCCGARLSSRSWVCLFVPLCTEHSCRPLQQTHDPPAPPCCSPQGQTCAGAAAAPVSCTADNANPYLGQGANSCTSCNNATTKYTSLEGAAYCTVPYFDRTCSDSPLWNSGGYEWDEHNATCVKCRPGTYRSTAMLRTGASPNPECQEW